jgi:hypothetical protein
MRTSFKLLPLALVVLAGTACSDPTTDPGSNPPVASALRSTDALVYVVHGINGTDLGLAESLPVDVSVNGACALPGFTFRTITAGIPLPAGRYDLVVRLPGSAPCTGAPVIQANGVQLAARGRYTVVAHLDAAGAPTASIFPEGGGRRGSARLRVRHAAVFTPVDIRVNQRTFFRGLVNGTGGQESVAPGNYTVDVLPAGTTTPAASVPVTLRGETFYNAYAVGTPAKGSFEILLQVIR